MQVTHCQRWQTAMAVLSFTLATLMIVAGIRQLLHPWDLKHHAFFHGGPLPKRCMAPFSHLTLNDCYHTRECSPAGAGTSQIFKTTLINRFAHDCNILQSSVVSWKSAEQSILLVGAMHSTWVSVGELLSGGSYIMTACLFMKHVTMSHGSSASMPLSTHLLVMYTLARSAAVS